MMASLAPSNMIAVIGGGIGGLAAALALLRRGVDVDVYEQSTQLKEVGAGIAIGSNGTRVLDALGLKEALARIQVVLDRDRNVERLLGLVVLRELQMRIDEIVERVEAIFRRAAVGFRQLRRVVGSDRVLPTAEQHVCV